MSRTSPNCTCYRQPCWCSLFSIRHEGDPDGDCHVLATSAERAAEQWAEEYDSSADYCLTNGEAPVEVVVLKSSAPDILVGAAHRFIVSGEQTVVYRAQEAVLQPGARATLGGESVRVVEQRGGCVTVSPETDATKTKDVDVHYLRQVFS